MKHKLYLVAVSGDCSAQGMGDIAEVIPVDSKHNKIIKQFLMAQQEQDIELRYWKPKTEFNPKYIDNYYKCFDKLKDVGIFEHKYHARTHWELMFPSELEELDYKYKVTKDEKQEFMRLKKNRDLWIMEVTGGGVKPYKTKYNDKRLYVWWEKDDNCIDIYNTGNIYNEVEDETTTEHFNQL